MTKPVRSLRLLPQTTGRLNSLTGSRGELFYDAGTNSLRIFDGIATGGTIIGRTDEQIQDTVAAMFNSAGGNVSAVYNDTTGKLTLTADVQGFSGNYNDLTNKPTLAISSLSDVSLTNPVPEDHILVWDGTRWVNQSAGTLVGTGLITFTNATIATSTEDPLTIDDEVVTNGNLTVNGQIESVTGTSPEIFSDSSITLNAAVRISVSNSPFKLASFSTVQRDLLSAQNGDLIYNTTDNKIQGYQNGTWINLDGTV